jgi:hypothetical protein
MNEQTNTWRDRDRDRQTNNTTFNTASLQIFGSSSIVRELRLVALENSTGVSSSLNATTRSSNTLPLTVFEISATKETHRTQF